MFIHNFTLAIKICLGEKFFKFSGRAPRAEFWYFFLFNIILAIFIGIIDMAKLLPINISSILNIVLFFPTLAVGVRRMHDINKSGLIVAFFYCAFGALIVLSIAYMFLFLPIIAYICNFLLLGLFVFGLILLYFAIKKGTSGPNRFGEDPLSHEPWA